MTLKGTKVLVTGGLGFIGSHSVEALVHAGARVRIFDNYSTGKEENLGEFKSEVEIIRGDILDFDSLAKAVRGVEIVSHQAAQLEITRAIEDPIEDLTTNTIGTLNVFHACAKNGVSRILNASSAGVYGQAIMTPQHEDTHPTDPNWAYGVSKLANEKYSAIMKDLYGLNITNFRYAIVYGPREWYGRVLTIFLKRALDSQPLIIFGDGEQVRDFVYVKDLVAMHLKAITDESSYHQIFNVSTAVGTSINHLADQVLKATGQKLEIIHEDVPEGQASRYFPRKRLPMELKTLIQDNQKAKSILGWEPQTQLLDGLKAEWAWLQANPHRWQKMSY